MLKFYIITTIYYFMQSEVNMDNKTFLTQFSCIQAELYNKQNLLNTLKEQSTDTSAKPLDNEFIRVDKVNNANAIIVENIIDLEREISLIKVELDDITKIIKQAISELEIKNERLVLTYRYIYILPFKRISNTMFLSEAQIYRIHRSAIKNISLPLDMFI